MPEKMPNSYSNSSTTTSSWVKYWLMGFVVLLLCMIAVGGVTRLTRSGLSIVEWRPVSGMIPPITQEEWQAQFNLYKTSPEYAQVNSQFSLEDYKNIFLWEFVHRLLGRLIFFYALFPGLIFWRKKMISGGLVFTFCGLVMAQGLIGWLMVKSGLSHEPHVSPFMLALHFFSALTVLIVVYRQLVLRRKALLLPQGSEALVGWVKVWGVFLFIQVFYGCLTSGFKAGFSFNTFPLMANDFFPAGGLLKEPLWINFFENPATVQWSHRWIGVSILLLTMVMLQQVLRSKAWSVLRGPMLHLMGVVVIQVLLGILNILFVVPTPLAVIHQFVASLLIMAYFNILFRLQVEKQAFKPTTKQFVKMAKA